MDKMTTSKVDRTNIISFFLSNPEGGFFALRLTDQILVNSRYNCTFFCLRRNTHPLHPPKHFQVPKRYLFTFVHIIHIPYPILSASIEP